MAALQTTPGNTARTAPENKILHQHVRIQIDYQ